MNYDDDACLVWLPRRHTWLMADGVGTRSLAQARRFSRAEALLICRNAVSSKDGTLPRLPVRLADVLDMLRDVDGAEYVPGRLPWE